MKFPKWLKIGFSIMLWKSHSEQDAELIKKIKKPLIRYKDPNRK